MKKVRIPCTCDGCGKKAKCLTTEKGPRGWFYGLIKIPDRGGDPLIALACSEVCKVRLWRRVPKPSTPKKRK